MPQTLKKGSKNLNNENWKVYHMDGHHMFTCGENKAMWYLNRNLAIKLEEEANSIKLIFKPKGYGFKNTEIFGLAGREIRCVVSGERENLQRHHIIPYCYRTHFPKEYKTKNHHDVVLVTYKIHEQYEHYATIYKDNMAEIYNVPNLNELNLKYTKLLCEYTNDKIKMLSKFHSIFKNHNQIPQNILKIIIFEISKFSNIPFCKLIKMNYIQLYKLYLLMKERYNDDFEEFKEKNRLTYDHGYHVVSKLNTHEKLEEFVKMWRIHFVETMKPKYMPIGWSVDFRVKVKI